MRKKISRLLICPVCGKDTLTLFAYELIRNNTLLHNVPEEEMQDDDELRHGITICRSSHSAFPIKDHVGIFLSDADACYAGHDALLLHKCHQSPTFFQQCIQHTIQRIRSARLTDDSRWNDEERKYYDAEVETETQRQEMVHSIRNVPVWRIFLPRKKYIFNHLVDKVTNTTILEIGGGNCRTVARLFNPALYHFWYIGTDISFKRLLVAKAIIPEGDFIQASALNLPFRNHCFDGILSFGMLHHLPRPEEALRHADEKLKEGGWLAFHEPIQRAHFSPRITALSRKIFRRYEHSAHDGKINLNRCIASLTAKGHVVISYHEQISIIRAFLEALFSRLTKNITQQKWFIMALEYFDRIWLKTLCRWSNRFGPNAVLVVTRKSFSSLNA
jgi:SAM-dependent methyltransferase/uncharacterized protein YbaR (Trm112 family)